MIYDGLGGLDNLQATVDQTVMNLRLHADEFDFIAVRGCSGMLVGAPVSLALDKPLVVVRKPDEKSHQWGGCVVNVNRARGRYVFLDDMVSSGMTRDAVVEALADIAGTEYAATYLYHPARWRAWADEDKYTRAEIARYQALATEVAA
jgi:adenine/guanine phosphoribosyltransferase-like PRPP-binding protein